MNIELKGDKVRLVNTIELDIDTIIEFENLNEQFINKYSKEKHVELMTDPDCLHLSIKRVDNNKLIGHMILFGLESKHKILEFRRISIHEKGFGFGRETIRLLKKMCFEILKFHRLWFDVYDDNKRAINLYESENFIQEALLREMIKTENGYRSQRIYSMLDSEYKG